MTDRELLAAIQADFQTAYRESRKIQALLRRVQEGSATYADAQAYAVEVSRLIGTVWQRHFSALSDGQAKSLAYQLIPSVLDGNYTMVRDYARDTQAGLNRRANIGLQPQTPPMNTDRVEGLQTMVGQAERYAEAEPGLISGMENFTQNVVDESVRRNFEAQGGAGLSPKLIRRADAGACSWCQGLAGVYDYPVMGREVYRRHKNCHCVVEYDPGDGKRQDVHTKRWTEDAAPDKIEARKRITVHPDRNAAKTEERRTASAGEARDFRFGIQFFAKPSSEYPTIILPKSEYAHVMSEIATHMTPDKEGKRVFHALIGAYRYTVENNGFGDYRIIGKVQIDGG